MLQPVILRSSAFAALLFAIAAPQAMRAQDYAATPAAPVQVRAHEAPPAPVVERDDGLSAFATFSRVYTDYGKDDPGFTLGLDFTRYMRFLTPSVEARYTHSVATGPSVNQSSFTGSLKAEKALRKFHPYADLGVGYGVINFNPGFSGYTHDNSVIYAVGVGLDYRINRMFLVKLDAQQQYWHLGNANADLEPYNLSAGVVYRIPFGWARSH